MSAQALLWAKARTKSPLRGPAACSRDGGLSRTIFGGSARSVSVSNSLGDLLVPLLLGLSVEESDDGHGHVVAANSTSFRVGRQAVVHHVLADLFEVLFGGNATSNELDNSL